MWTKSVYDGAGRDVMDYTTDGAGGATWADAATVANDTVLEQVQTIYDGDGNVIETIDSQRFHNTTGTGPLGTPTSPTNAARVYYAANYYDNVDRLIASADAGTNDGIAWSRPGSVPSSSPTLLVTQYQYQYIDYGLVTYTIDPMGIITQTFYDNLGRHDLTVQDYTGAPQGDANDVHTYYYYDGDNNLTYVRAQQPGNVYQWTQYVYGATTAAGDGVNSNDMQTAIEYPDPTTGQPSASQEDKYLVNALGDVVQSTDRNGNVHQYTYDVLGRLTADKVTTLGAGVDGHFMAITYAYDAQGNLYLLNSLDGNGNIINQDYRVYNGLGQLSGEYQEHYGAANLSNRPDIVYYYNEMANGANNSRLNSVEYNNGYTVDYNYNNGLDSNISRLSSISDNTGVLESYKYLGLDTVVERDHPEININQTYISQNGQTGDGGDQYVGLDRFGRVVDQNWYSTTTHSSVDDYQYSYNPDSEVVARNNVLDASLNETYTYDNLGRLTAFQRANGHNQNWTLDALGNISSVTTNGGTQNRTSNQQNEYTSASGSAMVSYDANGNFTSGNLSGDGTTLTYIYDAWNRLVAVKQNGTTIARYSYDGLNHQVQITENGGTTDIFYSSSGQALEEYGTNNTVVTAIDVWSPVYVNALVFRQNTAGGHFALQDANWNVTAWVNGAGDVEERYAYDPYGAITAMSASWVPQSSILRLPYGWQGMRTDWYTGNLNFSQDGRVENPSFEAWQQTDYIGQTADVNLYRVEGDNPTNAVDPSGLEEHVLKGYPIPHDRGNGIPGAMGSGQSNLPDWVVAYWASKGPPPQWAQTVFGWMAPKDGKFTPGGGGLIMFLTWIIAHSEVPYRLWDQWTASNREKYGPPWMKDPKFGEPSQDFLFGDAPWYAKFLHILLLSEYVPGCFGTIQTPGPGGMGGSGAQSPKAPKRIGNLNAPRPVIGNRLPDRVTKALPEGVGRTAAEKGQARNFYKRNIDAARKWWEQRTGRRWPKNSKGEPQWAEHPRPLKDGGDPLFIEPGVGPDPNAPHMIPGPDGLTDQQRWGRMGGRPKTNP